MSGHTPLHVPPLTPSPVERFVPASDELPTHAVELSPPRAVTVNRVVSDYVLAAADGREGRDAEG